MTQWIEVKVRYEKTTESGKTVKVTDPYLVDALSCTEAEARVVKEVSPFYTDFNVLSVNKTKIAEVFWWSEGDKFYKVKVNYITIDEKTATEKRKASYILVQASSFKKALERFETGMKDSMADYEIEAISETKIIDVYDDLSGMVPGEKIDDGIANKHFKKAKEAARKFVKTVQSDPNLRSVEISAKTTDGQTYASVTVPGGASTHNPRGDDD